jgi:hypothetical protein
VASFLAASVGLCLRSFVTDDARFGWGMFGSRIAYTVHYEWVLEDGARVAHSPGSELRGIARRLTQADRAPWRPRSFYYGTGALRGWIRSYQRWLCRHRRPAGAVAIEARLRMAINPTIAGPVPDDRVSLVTLRYPRPPRRCDDPT